MHITFRQYKNTYLYLVLLMAFGLVWLEKFFIKEELIKAGLGWVYVRYCKLPLCVEWQGLQLAAQNEKRGLWGDSPWEYRRQKRR